MRKQLTQLIDQLQTSVSGIALSASENKDGLLKQSMDEFRDAMSKALEPVLPEDEEPLGKGLNHVATFANALREAANRVNALKTGRPSWMIGSTDDGSTPEALPEPIEAAMDRWIGVGVSVLRDMVNDTAELPDDEDDLARAEKAGTLVKIEAYDGSELLLKSALPDHYLEYLSDPVDILVEKAELARSFQTDALDLADALLKSEQLPLDVVEQFPELFEAEGESGTTRGLHKAQDENLGDGADPNSADDPGSDSNQDQDAGMSDDTPQNPIELAARLASIIVVVLGSVLQAGAGADQGGDDGQMDNESAGMPGGNVGLTRSIPMADVPLQKILSGEVEVDPSVADALELLQKFQRIAGGSDPTAIANLKKELGTKDEQLQALREAVARLEATPMPPKGVVNQVTVSKSADVVHTGVQVRKAEDIASRIDMLKSVDPEGGAAAREMLKLTHAAGGEPFVKFDS